MNIQITCSICNQQYSNDNPPRQLKRCTHIFCENCIKITRFCPLDRFLIDVKRYGIQGFPINQDILTQIQYLQRMNKHSKCSQLSEEQQICLLHNRKLQLICMEDSVKICANCGLFGQHKLHKIKTIDNVKQQFVHVAQQTNVVLQKLMSLQDKIGGNTIQAMIEKVFKQKKDGMTKSIKMKYQKMIDKIRKTQKTTLLKLEQLVNQEKENIRKSLQIQKMMQKKQKWFQQATLVSDLAKLEFDKIELISRYLDDNYHENGVIKRGQYLLVQLGMFQTQIPKQMQIFAKNIQFQANQQIQQKIQSYIRLYKISDKQQQKKQFLVIQKDNQDLLLPVQSSVKQNSYNDFPNSLTHRQNSILRQSIGLEPLTFANNISQIRLTCLNDYQNQRTIIHDQTRFSYQLNQKSQSAIPQQTQIFPPFTINNSIPVISSTIVENKKKKKLKIPEKFQQIVQDLKFDRSEVIDLGGAQLGDATIINLCEEINHTSKLKQLKLIRNKLTDESLGAILNACKDTNISSLNLGQNSFTDKALDLLNGNIGKNLKTITLSQNKINLRNQKNKILQFKKNGITISI